MSLHAARTAAIAMNIETAHAQAVPKPTANVLRCGITAVMFMPAVKNIMLRYADCAENFPVNGL